MGRSHKSTPTPDLDRLLEHIEQNLPSPWTQWPGGWPGQLEAAVIDAVFSVRARYGGPDTGVRAIVERWRDHRGATRIDDLRELAAVEPMPDGDLIAVFGNAQRLPGRHVKARAVVHAARALSQSNVRHAADLRVDDPAQRRAWTSVPGLGPVTWRYVGMLVGQPSVKADVMVMRFVQSAVHRRVDAEQTRDLVESAASRLDVDATKLDHAIWSWQRLQAR